MDLWLAIYQQDGTGKALRGRIELGIGKRTVGWAWVGKGLGQMKMRSQNRIDQGKNHPIMD